MTIPSHHDVDTLLAGMFADLFQKVRTIFHFHHWQHEPGGHDAIQMHLGDLLDVKLDDPPTWNDVLKYDGSKWINDTGGAGGTITVIWHRGESGDVVFPNVDTLIFNGEYVQDVSVMDTGQVEVEIGPTPPPE